MGREWEFSEKDGFRETREAVVLQEPKEEGFERVLNPTEDLGRSGIGFSFNDFDENSEQPLQTLSRSLTVKGSKEIM